MLARTTGSPHHSSFWIQSSKGSFVPNPNPSSPSVAELLADYKPMQVKVLDLFPLQASFFFFFNSCVLLLRISSIARQKKADTKLFSVSISVCLIFLCLRFLTFLVVC
jgi:hypothetical protein